MKGKPLEQRIAEADNHLATMTNKLEDIRGDASLHLLPDILKVIRLFKEGFNGTYKKIEEYDKLRRDMEPKAKAAGIPYKYQQRRLYLWEYLKEPYSSRYPESFKIRLTAHILAHIELRYYLRRNQEELSQIKKGIERLK